MKKEKGIAIIDPEREKELYQNLRSKARGLDLNESDTEIVFREIVSMSCRIQGEERSVAFLGPRGTFTEEASRRIFPESGIEYVACSSIFETFRTVSSGGAFYGVVPVENSTEGPVNTTLDLLVDSDLMVWAEIDLPISHNLIVKPGTNSNDLKIILSHPESYISSSAVAFLITLACMMEKMVYSRETLYITPLTCLNPSTLNSFSE